MSRRFDEQPDAGTALHEAAAGVAITLDIDWAPDCVIDDVALRLIAAGVRATWFVTHASPAVDRLRMHPALFELGIHPNFLANSTQGSTPRDVLSHCMDIVPTALSMRTHCLIQSTPLLIDVVQATPIRTDVSLYLPGHADLHATSLPLPGGTLTRLPFWWEDDYEMFHAQPDWNVAARVSDSRGLRILNFHPIHVVLNSPSMTRYEHLKRLAPRLSEARGSLVRDLACLDAPGTGSAFNGMLSWLAERGGGATIAMLAADGAPLHSQLVAHAS